MNYLSSCVSTRSAGVITLNDNSFTCIESHIGTKSMQNTSAHEEPRSSGKRLHEYSIETR